MLLEPARREGRRFLNPVPTMVGDPRTMYKVLPKFFFGGKARRPSQPLGPFVTDTRVFDTAPASGLRVTWMGHSTMLIEMDGVRVLVDPMWDERASPNRWVGPKRFFAPPLPLDQLPKLDAVLISHDHYDHLGERTVRRLARLQPKVEWIAPLGVGGVLAGIGVRRWRELDWMSEAVVGEVGVGEARADESRVSDVRAGELRVTALPTRHFSGRGLWNRFETLWASFALVGPRHRVYYGADSGEWAGFAEIGARFGPFDLTMLEIGASDPLWAEIHMGPEGAVRSFRAMGGEGLLMPIHWGLFDLALHHWRQPMECVSSVEGLPLWSPTPGEPTEVIPGVEVRSEWWR